QENQDSQHDVVPAAFRGSSALFEDERAGAVGQVFWRDGRWEPDQFAAVALPQFELAPASVTHRGVLLDAALLVRIQNAGRGEAQQLTNGRVLAHRFAPGR